MSTLKVGTIQDHANSNTAITIDSGGRVFHTARPMFDVNKTTEQSVASGAITKVQWENENYDIGSCFDLGNNRFVAPIAGKYFMSAYVTLGTMIAGSGIGLQWFKNGSIFRHGHHQSTEINITLAMQCFGTFDLAANDYLEVVLGRSSSSDWNGTIYEDGTRGYTQFFGYLVG